MKSTGIIRKVDELGRIVLPIELRRTLDIAERDELEIYMEGDRINVFFAVSVMILPTESPFRTPLLTLSVVGFELFTTYWVVAKSEIMC